MNGARQRRETIRKRARKAMIRRLSRLNSNRLRKELAPLVERSQTIQARVFLRTTEVGDEADGIFKSSVVVHLPFENPGKTIMDMNKHGFWAIREHHAAFIPPGQILQVRMDESND